MNGIIYTRVSSDKQTKGTSLDTQEEACRLYCEAKGINVIKVFREEGASAKTTDRKEFLNAIDFCQKSKTKIDCFVVHKLDRFSRNTASHFEIKAILSKFGVTLYSVTEPIGTDPSEQLLETIMAGFAEFDNSLRRKRCMDGMLAKIHQGLWPWKAPIGYTCAKFKKQGLKKIEADKPDPQTFSIIQRALKEYSKGIYSQADIGRILEQDGLHKILNKKKISPQFIDKILGKQLPFYAGLLVNPWPNDSGSDALVNALHTPMISKEEMEQIKLIRSGKKKVMQKWNRLNPKFPLRRTALCSCCGKPLTGSSPKGNGGSYDYYHCYNRECIMKGKVFATNVLEKAFLKKLKKVTPNQEFLELFKLSVIDTWKEKGARFEQEAQQYKNQINVLEAQRKRVFEMREDGSYSTDEFQERKAEIETKLATLKISHSEAEIEQFDIESAVNYATEQISNLPRLWEDLAPSLKPRFQKLVFPKGIPYNKNGNFGTAQLGCIYELNRHSRANKSTLVDPRGFEPPASSVQVRRSSQLSYGPK
jgi:site-specific DNA recombinase